MELKAKTINTVIKILFKMNKLKKINIYVNLINNNELVLSKI